MSGSEENKHPDYNQIQVINLKNIFDHKVKAKYQYTNFRLKLHDFHHTINYGKYFSESKSKYPSVKQSSTEISPMLSVHAVAAALSLSPIKHGKRKSRTSPYSPWSSKTSPFSPYHRTNNPFFSQMKKNSLPPLNEQKFKCKKIAPKNRPLPTFPKKNKNSNKRKTKKIKKQKVKPKSIKITTYSKKKKKKRSKIQKLGYDVSLFSNPLMENRKWDKYSFGTCIIPLSTDHQLLPKWPWLTEKYNQDIHRKRDSLEFSKYQMLIRSGGITSTYDEYTNKNDLLIYNTCNFNECGRIIDAYHLKLPSFKKKVESPAIVFDQQNKLFVFGGYCYEDGKATNLVQTLNMNVKMSDVKKLKTDDDSDDEYERKSKKNKNKWMWKKTSNKLLIGRYETTVKLLNISSMNNTMNVADNPTNKSFIVIGGKNQKCRSIKNCELYFTDKNQPSIALADLNYKRSKAGCVCIPERDEVIVGGGMMYGVGADQLEIYNCFKNKWMLYSKKLNHEHKHPLLIQESAPFYNPNVLYVCGDWLGFGGKKQSLGYVEWCDLRENKDFFNVLYKESIDQLFEFWAIRPNIWEPRTMLHFCM